MLLPAEIYPFLFHEEAGLRAFALRYFCEANDPAPLTADDILAAADRLRGDDQLQVMKYLSMLASTETSTARIIDGLRSATDENVLSHLSSALTRLPVAEMRRLLGDLRLLRKIPPRRRADLGIALTLGEQTFDELWRTAETCTVKIQSGRWIIEPELRWVRRLAQAMARFPEQAAARALDTLLDAPVDGRARWLQAVSLRVLEYVRHPGTLVPLLAVLRAGDSMLFVAAEWAVEALVHLGTREVVAAVAAGIPTGSDTFRMHASYVLGRIKRPESEQALLSLFAVAPDVGAHTQLGMALCSVCTTSPEALDGLRALVSAQHFEPGRGALDTALLDLCALQGFQPVEAPVWLERIAVREARDFSDEQ